MNVNNLGEGNQVKVLNELVAVKREQLFRMKNQPLGNREGEKL